MFATKPDLLPRQYVEALKFVFEDCHSTSFRKIRDILKYQLSVSVDTTFVELEQIPKASATIAQVHVGLIKGSGKRIAMKVQHPGSSELMRSDIRNMLLVSQFMEKIGLSPPFDHTGVLKEYALQVYHFKYFKYFISHKVLGTKRI